MRHLRQLLQRCSLFKGYVDHSLHELLESIRYRLADFSLGQIIAVENAPCSHLGILLEGEVEIQKSFPSGKVVSVSRLGPGEVFGEALLFSEQRHYPATIVVSQAPATIMFISYQQVRSLCQSDSEFFTRFAGLLSNKILMLNKKVQLLTYPSVRQKVIAYLLDLYDENTGKEVVLPVSRQAMAQQLGIPRPSLSRELVNLRRDGLIKFQGKLVLLNDVVGMTEHLLY